MNAMSEIEIRDSCSDNSTTTLFSGSKSRNANINLNYLQDLPFKFVPNFEHLFHHHHITLQQQQQQQQFVFDNYAAPDVDDNPFFHCNDDQDSALDIDVDDINLSGNAVDRSSVFCNVNSSGSCLLFSSAAISTVDGNNSSIDIETPNWLKDEPSWLGDEPANDINSNGNSSDDIIGSGDDHREFPTISYIDFPGQDLIDAGAATDRCSTDESVMLQEIVPLCEDGVTDMKVAKASAMAESKVDDVGQLNVMNPAGDFGDDCIVDHDGYRFRQSDKQCTGMPNRFQPSSLADTTTAEAKCMNPEATPDCNEIPSAVDEEAEERYRLNNMMAATDHETFKDCLAHELQDLTSFESNVGLCGTVSVIRSHSGSNESCIGSPQSDPSSMGADQAAAILGGVGVTSTAGIFPNSAPLISTASISSSFAALIPSAAADLYSNNYNNAVSSHAKWLPPRFLHGHNDRGGGVPLFCSGGNPAAASLGSVQELMRSSNNISSFSLPSESMTPSAAASPHSANAITVFRSQDRAMQKDHGGTQLALLRSRLVPRLIDGASDAGMNVASGHADGMPPSNSKSVGVHDLSSLHWKSPAAKTRAARKRRMAKSRLPPAAIQQPAAAKGWPSAGTSTLQGSGRATGTKKMQGKDRGSESRSKGGGGGTKVPPPAALDLPQGKRSGPGSVNAQLRFLLQKELKPSDVGTLGRIVLPKRDAEAHLPDLTTREGINLVMEDLINSKVWNLRFRFWPNNKSRMYLLENTRDFVKTHNLQEGDFLMIYKDDQSGKYLIRAKKVARLDHASNNASSGRKLHCSSSQGVELGNSCHIMSDHVNQSANSSKDYVNQSANSSKDSDMEASFQDSLTMQEMVAPKLEHDSLPCLDNDTKIEINDIHIEEMFEL